MDNVIPPLNTSQVSAPSADKNLTGTIGGLTEQIGGEIIAPGQSAMLAVLGDARNAALKTLTGTISLTLNGQLFKIPVELKLDTPLKLPDNAAVADLDLKLQPQKDGAVMVRVLSVNGENPEKYMVRANENQGRPQTTAPFIKDTSAAFPKLETAPLRAGAVLENLAAELKIPTAKLQPLLKEFAALSSRVSVSLNHQAIQPQNLQPAVSAPVLPTLDGNVREEAASLPKPLLNMQNIMSDFAAGKLPLPEAARQLENELIALGGRTFPAEIALKPDNGSLSIRASFAEVPIENSVKLGGGLPVLLELEGFERNLPLSDDMVETAAVGRHTARMPTAENILKILQPLLNRGQTELAAAVLNRIPEPSSPRMLANMVAYIKASGEHNLSRWLGSDIVDKLSATTEGREVVAKLGTIFVSSSQDNINWRIMEVPILNGHNLSKIRIAVKKILDEEEKKKRRENRLQGTRFVVDTSFSRLGSLQFDGYALAKDKRFDLIIRTERDIGSDFCANVMRLFKTTLHEEGYAGTVKINVKEKFIKICDDNVESQTLADGIYI